MSHTLVWVDIPVLQLDRAIAFYGAVLAAPVRAEGGPGFTFGLLPQEGVSGCLYPPADGENAPSRNGPLIYLNVDGRLDDAVTAALGAGGRLLRARHEIGPHGWRAIVLDSEGNRIALHAMTP